MAQPVLLGEGLEAVGTLIQPAAVDELNVPLGTGLDVAAVLQGFPPQYPVNDPFQIEHIRQKQGMPCLYRGSREMLKEAAPG